MHALILDAQQRSALAAARSLGRRGLQISVADSRPSTLAGASRYVVSELVYPDPAHEPHAFTEWVRATTRRLAPKVVMPMTDLTTMLLASLRDELEPTALACGPMEAYEKLSDKGQLIRLAHEAGLRTPETKVIRSLADLQELTEACTFPLVLKPVRSKVLQDGHVISTSVFIARDPAGAMDHLGRQSWFPASPCLAQEFIDGAGAGVFTLYWHGAPLAWFAHRRLREKPPGGGVSVFSESAPLDERLRELSERLLSAARWHGPAMVEFRIARDGTPYVMEVNCRFWGSLQLSIDSGLDFPWLFYQHLTNQSAAVPRPYRVGQRLRWLLGDVDNLLIQMKGGGHDSATKQRALRDFLAACFDFSSRQEVLRWTDPAPAMRELVSWFRALA
jgi:predicted ATP-grasp superfamily ATP-dependent carboligase